MKKKILIGVTCISSLLAGLVFAQSTGTVGTGDSGTGQNTYRQKLQAQSEIMKQLKEKDKVALQQLYNDGLNFNEVDIDTAQRDIDDLSNQLNSISNEFTSISAQRKVTNEKYQQVKFAMQQIIDLSNQTRSKVNERATKIRTYTKELMEVKKQMEITNTDIANAKSLIIRFANVLYRANNEYYNGSFQIDEVKLLIKSDNIADTLSAEELVKILSMRFDQLISYLNNEQTSLEERRKRLDILRMQYKNEVSEYNNEIELLKEQKKYLLEFLNLYRQDKISLDLKAQNLFDDRESIKKDLSTQVEQAQMQMKGTLKDQLNSLDDMEENSRYIGWPVFPIYHYTDAKNDTTYTDIYGENNMGIDISSKQYNPVYAPADGVVVSTRNAEGISLNRIVIAHKYGYTTVMSSLNKIYVKKGQVINRGELIGISGGEPGTRGAGFASNGPKLHIEVFKNGLPVHPFTIMDLSVVQNPQIIPFEFEFKLITDKESRTIKLDDVEIMPGKTLAERRRQYLEKFGFGEFASLTVREDAATDHKVDIDMGICIATAESGMGRNLSSAWNVGNVGNNDRGDRIDFETPAQGAGMIYYALENKHLGGYDTIFELSGYGNKKGAIYASSETNWMTNVSKCLTSIKGFQIPEHFPFRLPEIQNSISGNKKTESGK